MRIVQVGVIKYMKNQMEKNMEIKRKPGLYSVIVGFPQIRGMFLGVNRIRNKVSMMGVLSLWKPRNVR